MTELTREDLIALKDSDGGFSIRMVGQLDDEMSGGRFYGFSAELIGDGGIKALNGLFGNDLPPTPIMLAAPALLAYAIKADERVKALEEALDVAEMGINPESFLEAAMEIDCGSECRHQQCGTGPDDYPCKKWEAGEYCPGAVAQTLEAVGKTLISLQALKGAE